MRIQNELIKPQSNLKCIDDEIDEYDFVDIDSVSEKLSQEETQGFWNNIMKNINKSYHI